MRKKSIFVILTVLIMAFSNIVFAESDTKNNEPSFQPTETTSESVEEEKNNDNLNGVFNVILAVICFMAVGSTVGIDLKLVKEMSALKKKVTELDECIKSKEDTSKDAVREEDIIRSNLYKVVNEQKEEYRNRVKALEAEHSELDEKIKLYCESVIESYRESAAKAERADRRTQAQYSILQNEGEIGLCEQKRRLCGLQMYNGSVKLCEGNYVYPEENGDKYINIYPSEQIRKRSVQTALINFFECDGDGNTIDIIKPCILEKTSMNYKIAQKGKVKLT